MSLLMQALKKAEQAKQKQAGASTEPAPAEQNPGPPLDEGLSLSPKEAAPEAAMPERSDFAEPVKTELQMSDYSLSPHVDPTVSAPLPIESVPPEPAVSHQDSMRTEPRQPENFDRQKDKLAAVAATAEEDHRNAGNVGSAAVPNTTRDEFAPKNWVRPLPPKIGAEHQQAAAQAEKKIATAQQQAKTVFASKQPVGKRRTVLLAGAGIAASLMLAGAGYVYWQISGPSASSVFVNTPAPLPVPATTTPPEVAPSMAPTVASAPAAINGATGTEPLASTVKPATGPVPAERETAKPSSLQPALIFGTAANQPATEDKAAPVAPKTQVARTTQTAAATHDPSTSAIQIRHGVSGNQIHPSLEGAYRAFISGDAAAARRGYQNVLQLEPNNRDALLGLAAIAQNQHQSAQAGGLYVKLLELDPSDPDAIAGMSSLQHGDPLQSESELKKSLAQNPQSGAVLFALGNLYAQQSRWAEAQQTYFRAFGSAPENPDFAFNLAVSLDRLNQAKLAQEYYRRALALAQNSPGNFSRSGVQSRIKELQAADDN